MSPPVQDPAKRFDAKWTEHQSGCWMWTGGINHQGYGKFWLQGRTVGAHQYSYWQSHGEQPAGMQIDHTCHEPETCKGGTTCPHRRCVNPAHLELVTPRQNSLRGNTITAKNTRKTSCPRGHRYDMVNINGDRGCRLCQMNASRRHNGLREVVSLDEPPIRNYGPIPTAAVEAILSISPRLIQGDELPADLAFAAPFIDGILKKHGVAA